EIASGTAQAQSDWMTSDFVPFKAILKFSIDKDQGGTLVFMNDNPSGLKENEKIFNVPVNLQTAKMKIKVYFNNPQKDNNFQDCSSVFPVEREIIKTITPAKISIEELLKGVSAIESIDGYITSIPGNVKLQKITILNGIAKVDFDEGLEKGVGGSCRVAAIRSQIVQTLKQFASIKEVVISINGRTEDILQP
ncbi:MAG: GerMN domain-containing protein, partial [Candidatus Parcubacteria bacterium]|nr:GerMN domain-containing protein [Candidatus Parcubacteria bacterium]